MIINIKTRKKHLKYIQKTDSQIFLTVLRTKNEYLFQLTCQLSTNECLNELAGQFWKKVLKIVQVSYNFSWAKSLQPFCQRLMLHVHRITETKFQLHFIILNLARFCPVFLSAGCATKRKRKSSWPISEKLLYSYFLKCHYETYFNYLNINKRSLTHF